jgi:hypothetical protein
MWKHRTNKGRVVYERKKKAFRWRDVSRIAGKLESPTIWDDGFLKEYWFLLQAAAACLEAIASSPFRSFRGAIQQIGDGDSEDFSLRLPIIRRLFGGIFGFERRFIEWQNERE